MLEFNRTKLGKSLIWQERQQFESPTLISPVQLERLLEFLMVVFFGYFSNQTGCLNWNKNEQRHFRLIYYSIFMFILPSPNGEWQSSFTSLSTEILVTFKTDKNVSIAANFNQQIGLHFYFITVYCSAWMTKPINKLIS